MAMTRAERRRVPRAKRLKELKEQGVPHKKDIVGKDAIVPRNMDQVRALLSGRDERFREPITRREDRAYTRVHANRTGEGHRGYTKPKYASSDTRARKERQAKQSKSWTEKRKDNNRKTADKKRRTFDE